jgi:UDP-N-acetylmuramate--alanine ligase
LRSKVVLRCGRAYRCGMTSQADLTAHPWFFCGIGGSGMLPLALILRGKGAQVGGSDRSFDQGRTPEKRAWLEAQGFELFPQDGSGVTSADQTLIASAAIEDTVPEMVRARELGCPRMTRAELLSTLFNAAQSGVAVGGTSGKSTVTGMLGWIMHQAGRDPTIMNGAVMKNFVTPDVPFASARVGRGDVFVSEVDESDGSIALYSPQVSVLLNVSLDHKGLDELRVLFGDFLAAAPHSAVNIDDAESRSLLHRAGDVVTFGIDNPEAMIGIVPGTIDDRATSVSATVIDRRDGSAQGFTVPMPGRHNVANALAAIAGAVAAGISAGDAARFLDGFQGIARRFDIVGTSPSGITVIDDFGHNPEKVRATLRTLKSHPGRVIAFFQPHGYGPLRQMGHELALTFAEELGPEDVTILCDPVYFGGTVDRSEGSERIVRLIEEAGGKAKYVPSRDDCGKLMVEISRPGDRIAVMGARDDTLTTFAKALLSALT